MFRIDCGAGFSSDRLEPAVDLVREDAGVCVGAGGLHGDRHRNGDGDGRAGGGARRRGDGHLPPVVLVLVGRGGVPRGGHMLVKEGAPERRQKRRRIKG